MPLPGEPLLPGAAGSRGQDTLFCGSVGAVCNFLRDALQGITGVFACLYGQGAKRYFGCINADNNCSFLQVPDNRYSYHKLPPAELYFALAGGSPDRGGLEGDL